MALTKRIIPCLDVKDGQTVKGINFEQLMLIGDPVVLARYYSERGADELLFLDITATTEKRKTFLQLVTRIARDICIPFAVGGGINSVADVYNLLHAGADKVSVNTAAVKQPGLLTELAKEFGSQCIILATDARVIGGKTVVCINAGRVSTNIIVTDWVRMAADMGAGEILLTSIDHDGTRNGFAVELTRSVAEAVNIPVIASGGAGSQGDFTDIFTTGKADAALAASIFHNKEIEIADLKTYLKANNINVRI
jgi:cyclase